MNFMVAIFQHYHDKNPDPVPTGQTLQAYFNDHFEAISKGPTYTWFQAEMIVTAYKEQPICTFKKTIMDSGNLK